MRSRSRDAGSRMEPDTSAAARPLLTDEQWAQIADLFPEPAPDPRGGRPRTDARRCLEGILWVLTTGARWKDLPSSFPSYVTCWRRFGTGRWMESGSKSGGDSSTNSMSGAP
jgi:transposase